MELSKNTKRLFWLIVLAGILARLYSFLVLPESALADAPYHALLSRNILESGQLFSETFMRTPILAVAPLYYLLEASFLAFANFPATTPVLHIFPALLSFATLALSYPLFKHFLKDKAVIALAFLSIIPWGIRYGTVNYPENLAMLLLAANLLLTIKYASSLRTLFLFPLPILLIALAISKPLMLPIAILIALYLAFISFKNSKSKAALSFSAATAIISVVIFALLMIGFSTISDPSALEDFTEQRYTAPKTTLLTFALESHASFYDFPPKESFQRVPLLSQFDPFLAALLFSIILLPLTIALIAGAVTVIKKHLKENNYFLPLTLLLILIISAYSLYVGIEEVGFFYMRPLLPLLPICALFLGIGYLTISKNALLRKLAILSLATFAIYSLAYTSVSANYYAGIYSQHEGMYSAISELPGDVKIFNGEKGRAIGLYAHKHFDDAISKERVIEKTLYELPAPELNQILKENSYTHLAATCFRTPWKEHMLQMLRESEYFESIYKDDCTEVLRIN